MSDPLSDHSGESAPSFEPPSIEELGAALPQFEFRYRFACDRTGALYRAWQDNLDRDVCIKVLPPVSSEREEAFRSAFRNEALTMARLTHPNIVQVYDFGQTPAGLTFFVMEYVEGNYLARMIRERAVNTSHLLLLIPQICRALEFAHGHSVVHCDIRPANILLSQAGRPKVANFAFSTVRGRIPASTTTSGSSIAAIDYLAPELRTANPVIDHRVDIYGLGAVIYEMLTGNPPRGAWKQALIDSDADPGFVTIVEKAMAPDPDDRFQSAGAIAEILENIGNRQDQN